LPSRQRRERRIATAGSRPAAWRRCPGLDGLLTDPAEPCGSRAPCTADRWAGGRIAPDGPRYGTRRYPIAAAGRVEPCRGSGIRVSRICMVFDGGWYLGHSDPSWFCTRTDTAELANDDLWV